jgi:hypothetical protein
MGRLALRHTSVIIYLHAAIDAAACPHSSLHIVVRQALISYEVFRSQGVRSRHPPRRWQFPVVKAEDVLAEVSVIGRDAVVAGWAARVAVSGR